MDDRTLNRLLEILGKSGFAPEEAFELLNGAFTQDLGFAKVDGGRMTRTPLPEIVLAEGKTFGEILEITRTLLEKNGLAIVSRLDPDRGKSLLAEFRNADYSRRGRIFTAGEYHGKTTGNGVAVVTGGTSDLHAAEEAAMVLEVMKVETRRFYDVGVAGLHRLGKIIPEIRRMSVCLIFAGMDAALPTVLGALYGGPVIAVPTSTGYGTALGGISALLAMLNSCSPGICVMNIDNGLGAAAAALRILRGNR